MNSYKRSLVKDTQQGNGGGGRIYRIMYDVGEREDAKLKLNTAFMCTCEGNAAAQTLCTQYV